MKTDSAVIDGKWMRINRLSQSVFDYLRNLFYTEFILIFQYSFAVKYNLNLSK